MLIHDSFLSSIIDILRARSETVTFAESCTAGLTAARLVDIAGASDVFKQGYITYCDAAKHSMLNVRQSTLDTYTAVSSACAEEMAYGAADKAEADAAVSVTGYAGGMVDEPSLNGLVYIGVFYKGHMTVKEYHFSGDRREVRLKARDNALLMLGEALGVPMEC